MKRYRIRWRSRLTGFKSQGEPLDIDRDELERVVARLNRDIPEIDHWIISA